MGNLFRTGGGNKELVAMLLGELSSNTRAGIVTFQWDIKNKTDKWRKLTNNNFYPHFTSMGFIETGSTPAGPRRLQMRDKSYNSNTGILTVNFYVELESSAISDLTFRCNCYLVM